MCSCIYSDMNSPHIHFILLTSSQWCDWHLLYSYHSYWAYRCWQISEALLKTILQDTLWKWQQHWWKSGFHSSGGETSCIDVFLRGVLICRLQPGLLTSPQSQPRQNSHCDGWVNEGNNLLQLLSIPNDSGKTDAIGCTGWLRYNLNLV